MEQLEDRVLFDAVPDAGAIVEQPQEQPFDVPEEQTQSVDQQQDTQNEVIFVDGSVPQADELLADLLEQKADRSLEIHLLDADRDGVEQIAATLEGRSDIDAIHIVSHGDDAELYLGTGTLNAESMAGEYADELATIGSALSADADLLIYGCDFGQGVEGSSAAHQLAELTGADVAASTDDTGDVTRGGDWDLELTTGVVETSVAFSTAIQENWNVLLATPSQEFYIPITEQGIYDANEKILNEDAFGAVDTDVRTIIGITANRDNTIIYYDHVEDGFEADLVNPTQATTEIWGDGDASNGIAPGYTVDIINAGDVVVLENVIDTTNPPTAANPLFNGNDRFASDTGLAVTRAGWNEPFPSTVLAGTTEVAAVNQWGTNYVVPVGEDTALFSVYEYTGAFVQAAEDGTVVDIDLNDGSAAFQVTLNQGESYHVDGGVNQGATIDANKAINVNLITGDRDSGVDSRWYRIRDRDSWADTYFSPAGTTSAEAPASIVVYNPHNTDLDVNIETLSGTVTRTIAAGETFSETLALEPTTSGAKVTSSDGRDFYAILAMDTDATHTTFDWGYSLLSEADLTEMALTGWAVGTSDLSANGSPLWVTADAATTIFIDFDGDPNTGANTDIFGNRYDQAISLDRLESAQIYDTVNNDNDQSQTRLYTTDGTEIAVAWGLDPSTAGPGSPFLDLGTVVLPFPLPKVTKLSLIHI